MSVSRSYNRIVFLTTLSVYLGLVLVGGTAPVLAHSALTKHFDIRNEIEFKDDLDNKPDNEEIEDASDDFPALLAHLLSEVKANIDDGKILSPIPKNFNLETFRAEYEPGSGFGTGVRCGDGNLFYTTVENGLDKFQQTSWKLADHAASSKNSKSILQSADGSWTLKISFSKEHPAEFADFLNRKFSSSVNSTETVLLKQIYKNSHSSFENNQVFIITHLPRAAIDEFLAAKNAQ